MFQKTSYNQRLLSQARLENQCYKYDQILPCTYFWKELLGNYNQLSCWIPDTLIINESLSQLIWINSNSNGIVKEQKDFHFKDYIKKITYNTCPNELVATIKKPSYNNHNISGQQVKIVNSKYLHSYSHQQFIQKDQVTLIQKYIKSHGNKPFIVRTIWNKHKTSFAYIITNKSNYYDFQVVESKRFCVKVDQKYCQIVKSTHGKHLKQTKQYLKNIAKFMQVNKTVILTQIVGDFIKDQSGNWWLSNIKAFKKDELIHRIHKTQNKVKKDKQNRQSDKKQYQKTKICRYCENNFLQSQLKNKMTIKMLIEVDQYLMHIGANYRWLKRSDTTNMDVHCLYQQHRVCQRCYRLYSQIQLLMKTEKQFLKQLNYQLDKQQKQLFRISINKNNLQQQSKIKEIKKLQKYFPQMIQLSPNSRIILHQQCPYINNQFINEMYRYRLILYFNSINDMFIVKDTNYYLEYQFMNNKIKFKLNVPIISTNNSKITIILNKLKIHYFFAHKYEQVHQYLSSQTNNLNILLFMENNHSKSIIGKLNLPLGQLVYGKSMRRQFYKYFQVRTNQHGWGLYGHIALYSSQQPINTHQMIFTSTPDQLLYIPQPNYYYCQTLPQDWIQYFLANKNNLNIEKSQELPPAILQQQNKQDLLIEQKQSCNNLINWQDMIAKQIIQYNNYNKI